MNRRPLVATFVAAVAALAVPPAADACCVASPPSAPPVRIADQEILIVWDPVSRTEHFVRRAAFGAARPVRDFGFLVPSPTRPEVEAANGAVFDRLRARSAPRVVDVDRWRLVLGSWLGLLLQSMAPPAAGMRAGVDWPKSVEVLEQKQVAGYDVAVLAASDAGALADWLAKNGYDARPALREWVAPYVERGWIVTAFKYASRSNQVATEAVRMSFRTERPFFAYRVPKDQLAAPGAASVLRTYVVAPGRATGTLGEGPSAHPWSAGTVKHARPIAETMDLELLLGQCAPRAAAGLGSGAWLTAFDDATWPGGTEDLTFDLDPAGAEFEEVHERVHVQEIVFPGELLLGGLVAALVVARRRAKPKA